MTRKLATTRHGATLAALACALALVPAGTAQARLGDLDPSFDGDGIATLNVGAATNARLEAVAARPGGGPVTAGWALNGQGVPQALAAQLQSNGQPDTDFSPTGVRALPASHAYGVALDGSQRVLVAGGRPATGATTVPTVLRVGATTDGPFDIGAALGEAHAVMPVGGDILVAGWRRSATAPRDVFFVARRNENGTPDDGFGGGDGVAEADFGVNARAYAMAVDAAGRIVLAGIAGTQPALARFSGEGAPDDAFGEIAFGAGELRAVAVDGIGRITAAGSSGSQALVVRRLDDGAADAGFGNGGETRRDGAALNGLALDGARALVAGTTQRTLLLGSLDAAGAHEPALAWRSFPGATEALGAALGEGGSVYTAGGPAAFVARHLPNAAPTAVLNGPAQVVAGAPAAFDAGGSSDPESEPLRFEFDLDGDGTYEFGGGGSNPLAVRSFPAPGGYTIGVRVTDPRGASAAATHAVTVVAPAQPVPQPVLGERGVARPLSGVVRIRLPGTRRFVRLGELAAIPNGTEIDARKGRVFISVQRNASGRLDGATFFKGRFVFRQGDGPRPITRLKLSGGSFDDCTVSAQGSSLATIASVKGGTGTRKKRRVRKLWGDGRGRFRTRGRYGAATVRGTRWLTLDRCDGTKVRVVEGKVAVKDLARPNRPARIVRAGRSTLVPFRR